MPSALDDLREARTSNGAPSARNLIVTVFGDAVLPAGDDTALSVQSLATSLASFGVNERLVRTSLTRLVNDGVLSVQRQGRRSQYRVAPESQVTFRYAERRIYLGERSTWDGAWTTVVVDPSSTGAARAHLRDELAWLGFQAIGANVWVSPTADPAELAPLVDASRHQIDIAITRAPATIGSDWLARRSIDVDEIAERYRTFTERFGEFTGDVIADLEPAEAFKLRTLVIASFRRIVLSDPALPADLLPADWPEPEARRTANRVYAAVVGPSTEWFGDVTGIRPTANLASRFERGSKPRLQRSDSAPSRGDDGNDGTIEGSAIQEKGICRS